MTVTYATLEARIGVTFPTATDTTEPMQSTVTKWISTTAPATITEYGVTSSDELITDLVEDLYDVWKWRKNTKGGNTITTPAGSKGYQARPEYPSKRTKERHGLFAKEEHDNSEIVYIQKMSYPTS